MLFSYNYLLKFVLLGDEYVGKTSIVSRYFDLPIPCNYESTIGVDFNSKLVYNKSNIYKIQVWDTAGQERFRSIISSYYNGSCGIILVFDLSKYKTFANNTNNQVSLTVELYDNSTTVGVAIASKIPVPAGSSFVISDVGKTILEPNDEIRIYCNTEDAIDASLSILTGVS